ncbi:tctex1 domain-containing protein 2 [Sapajus apella]|uniref:Tctex1 domain-containing protein 2 n=1 Tax=Sapajus apella TaxID=9515 RepID=A0A6J3GRJ7_SAPAP|nr:tctex1 domain-containing protein 2 [Sapajus apella]
MLSPCAPAAPSQESGEMGGPEMGFDRYKMVVQVVIGEQRGEGVFMASRCFWDADTDNYTHDVFMNFILRCSSIWLFLLLNESLKSWEKM